MKQDVSNNSLHILVTFVASFMAAVSFLWTVFGVCYCCSRLCDPSADPHKFDEEAEARYPDLLKKWKGRVNLFGTATLKLDSKDEFILLEGMKRELAAHDAETQDQPGNASTLEYSEEMKKWILERLSK